MCVCVLTVFAPLLLFAQAGFEHLAQAMMQRHMRMVNEMMRGMRAMDALHSTNASRTGNSQRVDCDSMTGVSGFPLFPSMFSEGFLLPRRRPSGTMPAPVRVQGPPTRAAQPRARPNDVWTPGDELLQQVRGWVGGVRILWEYTEFIPTQHTHNPQRTGDDHEPAYAGLRAGWE